MNVVNRVGEVRKPDKQNRKAKLGKRMTLKKINN